VLATTSQANSGDKRNRIIEIAKESVSKYISVLEVISISRFDD